MAPGAETCQNLNTGPTTHKNRSCPIQGWLRLFLCIKHRKETDHE